MLIEVLAVDICGEGSVYNKRVMCFSGRAKPGQIHGVECEMLGRGLGGGGYLAG